MAKKPVKMFVCQSCGAIYHKWAGRCEACGEWNTISEETRETSPISVLGHAGRMIQFTGLDGEISSPDRQSIGVSEFDRVLGGGLVQSSVTLVGGDPGIGKSTLLLQAACALSRQGQSVLYISGEESVNQIRMRANRLGFFQRWKKKKI